MARFLGEVQGSRKATSRNGSAAGGLRTTAASWHGAITTRLYVDKEGYDCYRVVMTKWYGQGPDRDLVLSEGRFADART